MPNVLRNVLAILAGLVIGSGVDMALIALSPSLVPPPAGVLPMAWLAIRVGDRMTAGRTVTGAGVI